MIGLIVVMTGNTLIYNKKTLKCFRTDRHRDRVDDRCDRREDRHDDRKKVNHARH